MVVLWNIHTVKQSMSWFCLTTAVESPIPHWLCILHVHWCRDCETVPEQHWNKPATVSQSQCIPTQCKQTIFGIKNESEVQGQSSSDLTGILTALKMDLWTKFGNHNLNRWWVVGWTSSKWDQFWLGLHIVTRSDPVSKLPETYPGYRNDTLKTIL